MTRSLSPGIIEPRIDIHATMPRTTYAPMCRQLPMEDCLSHALGTPQYQRDHQPQLIEQTQHALR